MSSGQTKPASDGVWAGVDVGGRTKGFDAAVVSRSALLDHARLQTVDATVEWLRGYRPEVVAVDSPCEPAADGETSRECERHLARSVCGIRWTPDRERLDSGNTYYEWIVHGLELYEQLGSTDSWEVIEVFPTASWTRWAGPRGNLDRGAWSRQALDQLGLTGVPSKTSQDTRDAIAAAVTARDFGAGRSDLAFSPIVVPTAR
jgi:predicted nuclease with RNAse H fold